MDVWAAHDGTQGHTEVGCSGCVCTLQIRADATMCGTVGFCKLLQSRLGLSRMSRFLFPPLLPGSDRVFATRAKCNIGS